MRIPFTKYAIKRFNPGLEQQYAQCAVANDAMAHRSHARFHIISALLKNTCFVVDVDWGVGVIVNHDENPAYRLSADANPFFEFNVMDADRKKILNLVGPHSVPELAEKL